MVNLSIDSLEPWQDTLDELGTRVQEVEKKIALLKAQVAKEMQVVELAKVTSPPKSQLEVTLFLPLPFSDFLTMLSHATLEIESTSGATTRRDFIHPVTLATTPSWQSS